MERFLAECPEIFVTESWRSEERQKELVAAKLSYVKRSNHQDGLAVDIGFNGPDLYPADMKRWRNVADVAKKHGIDWGFDLWNWDKPHFQNGKQPVITTTSKPMKNRYQDVLNEHTKAGYVPVFTTHEGDLPLSEAETKTLIDIAVARLSLRLGGKK